MLENPSFWVAVAFFMFVGFLIIKKVPSMVGGMLDERAAAIRSELDEAKRLREEAEKLLADYKAKGAAAEAEARVIIDNAKREAESVAVEARKSMKESLERRTKIAEEKIQRAEAQAVSEVRSIAVERAVSAAEKVIRESNTAQNDAGLVAKSIKDVQARLS
jgi:F-type H+-transporting ATPase subunit b